MEYVIVILVSYLIGSLNSSIIITKIKKGIDIRDVNSKNPGASNATLTLGFKWGVVVFFLDVLKGFIPVFITKLLLPDFDLYWFLSAFSVLIGHVFPVFFKFKGGKGTSTYLGVITALFPLFGGIMFVVLVLSTVLSDYVIIGTLFLLLPPPFYMYFDKNEYHILSYILIILYILLSLYKHSNNLITFFKGEEAKVMAALKK
jgi:glycerol-3-phosphate acyltransferase PlsY